MLGRTHQKCIFAFYLFSILQAYTLHAENSAHISQTPKKSEHKDVAQLQPVLTAEFTGYDKEESHIIQQLAAIIREHHQGTPLRGFVGDTLNEYNLSKMPIAVPQAKGADVFVVFNWDRKPVAGMTLNEKLSVSMGKPIYVLKGVQQKQLTTQGETEGQIRGFSYLLGSKAIPGFSPSENSLPASHPLRTALGHERMTILNPDKKPWHGLIPDEIPFTAVFKPNYMSSILDTFIHESFHTAEAVDDIRDDGTFNFSQYSLFATKIEISKKPETLKLLAAYEKEVISASTEAPSSPKFKQNLANIMSLLEQIKKKAPETFNTLKGLEYSEGGATYAAGQVLINQGFQTYEETIKIRIEDTNNNLFYKTGALGGHLIRKLGIQADTETAKTKSYWEIISDNIQNQSVKMPTANSGILESVTDKDVKALSESLADYFGNTEFPISK